MDATERAGVGLEAIRGAAARIDGSVHRTPVLTCRSLDAMAGRRLHFKCENLQKTGAFKARGALNAVLQLPDAVARRGVVTHSSGNHGQALAWAASIRGIPAWIVMPRTAPAVKRAAAEGYGAHVELCEPTLAARRAAAEHRAAQTGGTIVHPYEHPHVIAGQGTVALELFEQVDRLDAVLVPVSGGGLISGIALAAAALRPGVRIIGVEPAGADDAARSLAAGRRVMIERPRSIADGLLAQLGERTWPIVRDHVERIVTVNESQIAEAQRLIAQRMKLVVEPSAAVTLAAALHADLGPAAADVALILSGGNVDG